jgi:hypothetical protein
MEIIKLNFSFVKSFFFFLPSLASGPYKMALEEEIHVDWYGEIVEIH